MSALYFARAPPFVAEELILRARDLARRAGSNPPLLTVPLQGPPMPSRRPTVGL
jgi:hypothetical protein